jgi:RNA polymerase sigma-70 factor (ECF subfamily)
MSVSSDPDSSDLGLLRRARAGDTRALDEVLTRYRSRLKRMVKLRLDPRVLGRVDPSDVVQEAYLEASQKFGDYLDEPRIPFFLWLRLMTGQKLALEHRKHLGVQARNAAREVSLHQGAYPAASSAALAARLLGRISTPSHAAMRAELRLRIHPGPGTTAADPGARVNPARSGLCHGQ